MKNNRKLLIPLGTMLVAAAVTVGSGATWTSTTHSNVKVTGGTLIHTNDHNNATLQVTKLQPGKTVSGTVEIANTGDINSVLTLKQTAGTSGFSSNLKLTLTEVDGTGADVTVFLPTAAFPTGAQTPVELDPDFDTGTSHKYRVDVTLDAASPDTDQGKTASLAWEFKTVPAETNAPGVGWVAGLLS